MLCLASFHSIGIKTSLFYDDLLSAERVLGEILALRSGEDWRGEKHHVTDTDSSSFFSLSLERTEVFVVLWF